MSPILLAERIMLSYFNFILWIWIEIFERKLIVDAIKPFPDLVNALIVALLVVLRVYKKAVASIDVVHCFQINFNATLSSWASIWEVTTLSIVLLFKLIQHLIWKNPLIELALILKYIVLYNLLYEWLLLSFGDCHVVV